MDPQATFKEFMDAINRGVADDAHEYGTYLLGWLDKGGFMPKIEKGDFSTILAVLLDGIQTGGLLGDDLSPGYILR